MAQLGELVTCHCCRERLRMLLQFSVGYKVHSALSSNGHIILLLVPAEPPPPIERSHSNNFC